MAIICIGSIDYAPGQTLDKKPFSWIRFKVVCESDGKTLWHDNCTSIDEVKEILDCNDIKYHNIFSPSSDIFIVRATSNSLGELKDWPCSDSDLCVRTFYSMIDAGGRDMFDTESCWLTTQLESKSIDQWYRLINEISIQG